MRYEVYANNFEALLKKVQMVQKKCAKYGCDFQFEVIGNGVKKVKDDNHIVHTYSTVIIEASGTARIDGWEFVATVEATESGNIFRKALTEVDIPVRYRDMQITCEHCNTNRARKEAFIVRNTETGEFKMLGRTCLKDYTKGLSVEAAAFAATILEEIEAVAGMSFGTSARVYSTRELLCYAAETVRHFGYVPSSYEGENTRSFVLDFISYDEGAIPFKEQREIIKRRVESVGFDHNSKEAAELVDAAVAWLDEQESTTDYMHNLKTYRANEYNSLKAVGVLASLFVTYFRAQEREQEIQKKREEAKSSQWVGEVGKRINVEIESVKIITSWVNNFSGYGDTITALYKIVGKDGNVYIWKTSKDIEDDAKSIVGTVKEHSEYNGVKQTVLTRCKTSC